MLYCGDLQSWEQGASPRMHTFAFCKGIGPLQRHRFIANASVHCKCIDPLQRHRSIYCKGIRPLLRQSPAPSPPVSTWGTHAFLRANTKQNWMLPQLFSHAMRLFTPEVLRDHLRSGLARALEESNSMAPYARASEGRCPRPPGLKSCPHLAVHWDPHLELRDPNSGAIRIGARPGPPPFGNRQPWFCSIWLGPVGDAARPLQLSLSFAEGGGGGWGLSGQAAAPGRACAVCTRGLEETAPRRPPCQAQGDKTSPRPAPEPGLGGRRPPPPRSALTPLRLPKQA